MWTRINYCLKGLMAPKTTQDFTKSAILFLTVFISVCISSSSGIKYEPNWNSLDSRPLPAWYDDSKIGIFIHWGIFSVPSYKTEWFWILWSQGREDLVDYMKQNYKPDFTYQDFAPDFDASLWDPNDWVQIFKDAGAK